MKARPRFTQRRWARTRSEIAPMTSPINSPSLPARHDRAQLDGGSSMSCFRIRRLTTLPQHVDRGPQRCASLDGMYSISSCSKGLSAAPYFLVAGSPTGTSAIGEPTVLAGCRAKPQFKMRSNLRPPGAAPVRIDAQHAGKVARVYGTRPEIFSRP
jgi:hypothetical protein